MNEAIDYLQPHAMSFWRWQSQGELVEWTEGQTIAFREEVLAMCQRLAPQGLPPFGAIVMLLAAMRNNWQDLAAESRIIESAGGIEHVTGDPFGDQVRSLLGPVLGDLDRLSLLSAELRTPMQSKATIGEIVFERIENRTTPATTKMVVEMLEFGLPEDALRSPHVPTYLQCQRKFLDELRCLARGLHDFDPATLGLRLQTGLNQIPEPADIEVPPAQRVRALLAELLHDEELSGLAMLARDLMAAVSLPRSLTDREELPIGGFSDIANRGSLDRLLLSELAHDDLTLAVRVAVNEALYLRRESPPKSPPCQRAVLLETGIRSWGVPRVFATAVALALVATGDHHTELQVYRAKGERIDPVDLTTRAGLTEHLAALDPDLHPGEALDAFQRATTNWDRAAEPVLITNEDVVADPQFRQALGESGIVPLLMATVNRDGRFRLSERTLHGERVVREAELNLEALFAEPKRTVPKLIDRKGMQDLPAILSVQPFPLRLSHNFDWQRTWRAGDHGALSLTNDRRLMLWTQTHRGAIQVTDNAPKGKVLWSSCATGINRVVAGHLVRGGLHLLTVDLERLHCDVVPLRTNLLPDVIFSHNGVLFVTTRFGCDLHVLDESSGELLLGTKIPQYVQWRHSRFFQQRETGEWFAAYYDGRTVRFESVVNRKKLGDVRLTSMFESEGVDGPIGVTERGSLYMTAAGALRKVKHGFAGGVQVLAISSDGKRIALGQGDRGSTQCSVVEVESLGVSSRYGQPREVVEPVYDFVRPKSYRTRFTHVRQAKWGPLLLTSRKGVPFSIEDDANQNRIHLVESKFAPPGGLPFKPVKGPSNVGYRLKVATWDDGSQVFLDSRGLLHLKSAGRSIPETTIVLNDEDELSGWCSDGRMWGTSYHLGDHPSADKRSLVETALGAFTRRLP